MEGPLDEMVQEIKLRPNQFMSAEELLNFNDPRNLVRRWRPNLFCTAATSSTSTPSPAAAAATPPYQSPSDMAGWVSPSTYLQDCQPRVEGENVIPNPNPLNDIDDVIEISSESDLDSLINNLAEEEPDSPLPSDLDDIEPFTGEDIEERKVQHISESESEDDECNKNYPSGLFVSPGKEAQPVLMDIDDGDDDDDDDHDDDSQRVKVTNCNSSNDHEIDLISDGTVSPIIGQEIDVTETPASPPPPPPPSPISSEDDEQQDDFHPPTTPHISNITFIRALFLNYLDTEGTCDDTVSLLRWYIYQTSGLLRISLFYVLTQLDIIEWHIDFLDCAFHSLYMDLPKTWCEIYRLFHESYLGVPFGCGPLYVYGICGRSANNDHDYANIVPPSTPPPSVSPLHEHDNNEGDDHDDNQHDDNADQPPTKKFKRS